MANENPTGGGPAVSLSIPASNMPFLRCTIEAARDGLRDELERFGDQLREPRSKLILEDAAYAALLAALDSRQVVPDGGLRAVLGRLAASVDHDNEYTRVVAEHDALHGLLAQLDGGAGDAD